MILDNIKIEPDKIDEFFLKNRPGVDPENYRVGKVEDKLVVYNPDTQKFMEYFYDDRPEIEWFDLEFVDLYLKGYKLNRDGRCLSIIKNSLELTKGYNDGGYPKYQFKGKVRLIHTLLAKYFIPNYDIKNTIFVDHIDRNRENYSLNNLKWISRLENNLNRDTPKTNNRQLYKCYSDKECKCLIKEYTEEEIYNSEFSKYSIKTRCNGGQSYKGFYWKIENLDIKNYLDSIGVNEIDNSLWELHYDNSVYVHPLGIIKAIRKGQLSVGHDKGGYMYFHSLFDGKFKDKSIHRLVAEVFLNNNKPIPEGLVVDHINTNTLDNRVENLRICTLSENMNNVTTKLNHSRTKKVIDKEGNIYVTITECSKKHKIPMTTLRSWIKNFPEKGFRYYEGDLTKNDKDKND